MEAMGGSSGEPVMYDEVGDDCEGKDANEQRGEGHHWDEWRHYEAQQRKQHSGPERHRPSARRTRLRSPVIFERYRHEWISGWYQASR